MVESYVSNGVNVEDPGGTLLKIAYMNFFSDF